MKQIYINILKLIYAAAYLIELSLSTRPREKFGVNVFVAVNI